MHFAVLYSNTAASDFASKKGQKGNVIIYTERSGLLHKILKYGIALLLPEVDHGFVVKNRRLIKSELKNGRIFLLFAVYTAVEKGSF